MDVSRDFFVGLLVVGLELECATGERKRQAGGVERNGATRYCTLGCRLRETSEALAAGIDLIELSNQCLGEVVETGEEALEYLVTGGRETTESAAAVGERRVCLGDFQM